VSSVLSSYKVESIVAPIPISRWIAFIALAIFGTAADLLSKQWVFAWRGLPGENPPWWIWEGYVGIETAVNTGALFGMGAGYGGLFAGMSIVAAAAIMIWLFGFRAANSWFLTIALGCVMGGIMGNLYDRLGLWYSPDMPVPCGVRDWILLRYRHYTWPNFNIADSLLVCGAIMLAWQSIFSPSQPVEAKS
jgi:signal peptidase II